MTVIITDAHYRMALAPIRDLAREGADVVACESGAYPKPVGFASRYVSRCVTLPSGGELEALYELCRELMETRGEKPALLPMGAKTLQALSAQKERFSSVCGLALATPEQLELLNDKKAVHALAQSLGLPVPREFAGGNLPEDMAFPCVVKPACGEKFGLHAESRYKIVHSHEELSRAQAHFFAITGQEPLVQEYLPGGALGCSVLADEGRVLAAICHRRLREYPVSGGPSSCCETIEAPELLAAAEKIMAATGFTGPAMVEFKEDGEGKPRILEINPRVWGTYPLTRVAGSNFSLLWCQLALGLELSPYCGPKPVKMVYYPSDFAAALGYLRRGQGKKCFAVLGDFFRPGVKSGLREKGDTKPNRVYLKSLFTRGNTP